MCCARTPSFSSAADGEAESAGAWPATADFSFGAVSEDDLPAIAAGSLAPQPIVVLAPPPAPAEVQRFRRWALLRFSRPEAAFRALSSLGARQDPRLSPRGLQAALLRYGYREAAASDVLFRWLDYGGNGYVDAAAFADALDYGMASVEVGGGALADLLHDASMLDDAPAAPLFQDLPDECILGSAGPLGSDASAREASLAEIESHFLRASCGQEAGRQEGRPEDAQPEGPEQEDQLESLWSLAAPVHVHPERGESSEADLEEVYARESQRFRDLYEQLGSEEAEAEVARAAHGEALAESERAEAAAFAEEVHWQGMVEEWHEGAAAVAEEISALYGGLEQAESESSAWPARETGFEQLRAVHAQAMQHWRLEADVLAEFQEELSALHESSAELQSCGGVHEQLSQRLQLEFSQMHAAGSSTQEFAARLCGETAESLQQVRHAVAERQEIERSLTALQLESRGLQLDLSEATEDFAIADRRAQQKFEELERQVADLERSQEALRKSVEDGSPDDPMEIAAAAVEAEVAAERREAEAERRHIGEALAELRRSAASAEEECEAATERLREEEREVSRAEEEDAEAEAHFEDLARCEEAEIRARDAAAARLETEHSAAVAQLSAEIDAWRSEAEEAHAAESSLGQELRDLRDVAGGRTADGVRSLLAERRCQIRELQEEQELDGQRERQLREELEATWARERQQEAVRARRAELQQRAHAEARRELELHVVAARARLREVESAGDALKSELRHFNLQASLATQEEEAAERLRQAQLDEAEVCELEAAVAAARAAGRAAAAEGEAEVAELRLHEREEEAQSEGLLSGFEAELEAFDGSLWAPTPRQIRDRAARALQQLRPLPQPARLGGLAVAAGPWRLEALVQAAFDGAELQGEAAALRALESAGAEEDADLTRLREEVERERAREAEEQEALQESEKADAREAAEQHAEHEELVETLKRAGQRAELLASLRAEIAGLTDEQEAEERACEDLRLEAESLKAAAEESEEALQLGEAEAEEQAIRFHCALEAQRSTQAALQDLVARAHEGHAMYRVQLSKVRLLTEAVHACADQEAEDAAELAALRSEAHARTVVCEAELQQERAAARALAERSATEGAELAAAEEAAEREQEAEAAAARKLEAEAAAAEARAEQLEEESAGGHARLEELRTDPRARAEEAQARREEAELEAEHHRLEEQLRHLESNGEARINSLDRSWFARLAALRAIAAEREERQETEQREVNEMEAAVRSWEEEKAKACGLLETELAEVESTSRASMADLQRELEDEARAQDERVCEEALAVSAEEAELESELLETEAAAEREALQSKEATASLEAVASAELSELRGQLATLQATVEEQAEAAHREAELEQHIEEEDLLRQLRAARREEAAWEAEAEATEAEVAATEELAEEQKSLEEEEEEGEEEEIQRGWVRDLELLRNEMLNAAADIIPASTATPGLPSGDLSAAEVADRLCDDCCRAIYALLSFAETHAGSSEALYARPVETGSRGKLTSPCGSPEGRGAPRLGSGASGVEAEVALQELHREIHEERLALLEEIAASEAAHASASQRAREAEAREEERLEAEVREALLGGGDRLDVGLDGLHEAPPGVDEEQYWYARAVALESELQDVELQNARDEEQCQAVESQNLLQEALAAEFSQLATALQDVQLRHRGVMDLVQGLEDSDVL